MDFEVLHIDQNKDAPPPSVTVVIPLYNYARFIAETLDSVSAQTLEAIDVIVIDDCSSDGGGKVACNWMSIHGNRFRRATVLRHLTNAGLAATRNTGFAESETAFVFPLDADNLLYPSCLQKLAESLLHTRAAFAYCVIKRFVKPPAVVPPPLLMHLHPWHPDTLHAGNKTDAMVLHRKCVWEKAGGYSTGMPRQGWEDYDFWFKIARLGCYGVHVPQVLALYRVHGESMLHTVTNENAGIEVLRVHLQETYPEFFQHAEHGTGRRGRRH